MPILHLTINRKWFDMIVSGEKKEEYRQIKRHWNRVFLPSGHIRIAGKVYHPTDVTICFRNGYRTDSPRCYVRCTGLTVGIGRREWGFEGTEQHILKLGDKHDRRLNEMLRNGQNGRQSGISLTRSISRSLMTGLHRRK